MNSKMLEINLRALSFQRNILAAISLILSLTVVILACFLFLKQEKVVIAPPIVNKEFWIDGNRVSPTYLEQFGVFLGQLLLNKSAQSASEQRTIILRHTDPSFYGLMRERLIEEETMLAKQGAAYTFYPLTVDVDVSKMEVRLTGDRIAFAGSKQVSSQKETYILKFIFGGSRLLLKGVQALENSYD
jgi:conjugal transfer pilus assembly protein TraE